MEKTLRLVGRTSGEIYTMRYPSSLQGFCDFDFSYFAKDAVDFCNESLKLGTADPERFADLRREIESSHCFIGQHIRTIYDKVVLDCWIDYLCRRDSVGTNTLWNRFMGCNTPFEKMVFARLCEYRYNRAINEWLNIVRVQDYARCKSEFVFTKDVHSAEDAAMRRDYFDLMFSVTAKEMGCSLEDLGVTKAFTVGRLPSAPFMFPNVSKEIVRHVLADFDYSDDYSDISDYSQSSDQIAMDAFAKMKAGLPSDLAGYNVVRNKMENYPEKIYMPCSLKAAVDLEIDTIIEQGGWLARCKRCGRLFWQDKEHREEYCSQVTRTGKTCLEMYEEEHPKPKISENLLAKCKEVTDKVYARVGVSVSINEYESWHSYLEAMKGKVTTGEISPEELEDFLNYSLAVDISRSKPIEAVEKPRPTKERVVKPFVPERISRSELHKPATEQQPEEEKPRPKKDGFFTSPTVQRQKNERAGIAHIIRAGEPRNSGFREIPAGQQESQTAAESVYNTVRKTAGAVEIQGNKALSQSKSSGFEPFYREKPGTFTPDYPEKTFGSPEEKKAPIPEMVSESENFGRINEFSGENSLEKTNPRENQPKPRVIRKNAAAISAYGKMAGTPFATVGGDDVNQELAELLKDYPDKNAEAEEKPPVKYETEEFSAGKIPPVDIPEQPDREPFRDVGSIFDVLEQSENAMGGQREQNGRSRSLKPSYPEEEKAVSGQPEKEPAPEWKAESQAKRKLPEKITDENAPAGFWKEDRNLFPKEKEEPEPSELDMLKEKKHSKSNKTRRLYDVIMREPDDNPNFRK